MAKYHHVTVDEIHDGSMMNEVTLPLLREYFLSHSTKRMADSGSPPMAMFRGNLNWEPVTLCLQSDERNPRLFRVQSPKPSCLLKVTPSNDSLV
jgi:hypothetical protein